MYYDYFGFKQPPFKITPDTNLFFPGGNRGAILDALIYAILNGEGIVKVVGEVGSGKTMLCRMLEKELPDRVEIVYLANPRLSPENTLHAIAFELKLPVDVNTSRIQIMNDLQQYLVQQHAENRQVVVFVEEAQGMPLATLEEIRLLSNLETQHNKLLQIVLFGQPELDDMIATPGIRQLKERITYSFKLNPFEINDIRDYLTSRLRACGYRSGELFDKSAIAEIKRYSNGLVRRINILSDKSLLAAYAGNTHKVTAGHVSQAARDSEFVTGFRQPWKRYLTVISGVIAVIVLLLWMLNFNMEESEVAIEAKAPPVTHVEENAGQLNPEIPAPESKSDLITINTPEDNQLLMPETAEDIPLNPDQNDVSNNYLPEKTTGYDIITDSAETSPENVQKSDLKKEGLRSISGDKIDIAINNSAIVNESIPVNNSPVSDTENNKEQIMGMRTVIELQDIGDSRLTDHESYLLQKQLQLLPPEVAYNPDSSQTGNTCRLCWSIIYRPLIDLENL